MMGLMSTFTSPLSDHLEISNIFKIIWLMNKITPVEGHVSYCNFTGSVHIKILVGLRGSDIRDFFFLIVKINTFINFVLEFKCEGYLLMCVGCYE